MMQKIRIKQIRIRVPGTQTIGGADLADRVANSIAAQSRKPVPEPVQRTLVSRLARAVPPRGKA